MTKVEPRFLLEPDTFRAGVVRATDVKRGRRVVLKFAPGEMIRKEADVYERLGQGPGIPLIFGRGVSGPASNGLISMQEFTQDLYQLISASGSLSMRLACKVAGIILEVLCTAHSKGIIHRDIKPQNIVCFTVDELELGKLAVIDWGLAADVNVGVESAPRFTGTPAFMSVSCLQGNAPHVLDDLESLLYLIHFVTTGGLPWPNSEDFGQLARIKNSWVPQNPSLRAFLIYVRDRSSHHVPDYDHLRRLLAAAA